MAIPLLANRPRQDTIYSWLKTQELEGLSAEQHLYLEQQLHLLMLHGLSAGQYKSNIARMLDKDQASLLPGLVDLRPKLIAHPDLNTWYKPVFLRYLRTRDDDYFSYIRRKPERVNKMLAAHPMRYTPKVAIRGYGPLHQQALFEEIRPELEQYIKGFVGKKMNFIVKSNRMKPEDLHHDLFCQLLISYRWLYPFRAPEHLLKSCKTSVKNSGINMIHYWTSQSRGRLIYNDVDGYNNRTVGLTDLMENNAADQGQAWEEQALGWDNEGLIASPDKMMQDLSMKQVMNKLEPKWRKALQLLLNPVPPPDFLDFAERLYNTRITDIDTFHKVLRVREAKLGKKPYSLFLRLVRKYAGLEQWEMDLLLRKVKNQVFVQ